MKRYQIKSKYYYIFWGIMALAVVLGQVYVGLGYRMMSESYYDMSDSLIKLTQTIQDAIGSPIYAIQ